MSSAHMSMSSLPCSVDCGAVSEKPKPSVYVTVLRRVLRVMCYAAAARITLGLVKTVLLKRSLHPRRIADATLTLDPIKWACVTGGWAAFPALRAAMHGALHLIGDSHGGDGNSITHGDGSGPIADDETWSGRAATIAAGAVSALPILVMNVTTRTELALYLTARATHGAAVAHLLPLLPRSLRDFEHWDTVAVGATGGQILCALVFAPETHAPSYLSFLLRCVFRSKAHFAALAGAYRGQLLPSTLALADKLKKPAPVVAADAGWVLPMGVTGYARFLVQHTVSFGLPLYLPLKAVLGVVMHGPRIMKDPVMFAAATARSTMWSSLFLTLYCANSLAALRALAAWCPALGKEWVVWIACALMCGPPTLLEPKGRRLSLALYCQMHAMRSARLLLYIRGFMRRPTRHEVLALYVASVACLFYQRVHAPETLHPNLVQGFRFLFGEAAPKAPKQAKSLQTA